MIPISFYLNSQQICGWKEKKYEENIAQHAKLNIRKVPHSTSYVAHLWPQQLYPCQCCQRQI
jgi:hypothetical protein